MNSDEQKWFSQNERRRADLASEFLISAPYDLVMIFQSWVLILPRFFDFERP